MAWLIAGGLIVAWAALSGRADALTLGSSNQKGSGGGAGIESTAAATLTGSTYVPPYIGGNQGAIAPSYSFTALVPSYAPPGPAGVPVLPSAGPPIPAAPGTFGATSPAISQAISESFSSLYGTYGQSGAGPGIPKSGTVAF